MPWRRARLFYCGSSALARLALRLAKLSLFIQGPRPKQGLTVESELLRRRVGLKSSGSSPGAIDYCTVVDPWVSSNHQPRLRGAATVNVILEPQHSVKAGGDVIL